MKGANSGFFSRNQSSQLTSTWCKHNDFVMKQHLIQGERLLLNLNKA